MSESDLTRELTAEYGQRVPAALIAQTVRTAGVEAGRRSLHEVEGTARTDVAALAAAVDRSASRAGGTA